MDGIKLQTPASSPYYLQYRTWNEGKTAWYSRVNSNVDDYAGAPNRPVQRLQIQVYQNDGTKLTEKVVVMYRARVAGRWLPWVSNADPEWMRSVHSKYNLGGTIDTDSYYAGNAGENMDGIEIRIYEEGILGDFTGGEVGTSSLQYMVGSLDNWTAFENGVYAEQIDGIKIQTNTAKGYYLQYRSWNEGKTDWYSFVKSTGTAYNDYAGIPGKPIQLLEIQAYKNDGTRLRSGVIVMYRVSVAGRWLPWVSNADAEWMRDIQNKHSLGGSLSVNSTYAGNKGQNIDGVEIHIFEDDSGNAGAGNFTGVEEVISASYMCNNLSNWEPFERAVTAAQIDGIHLGTDADEPYYFMYKSWNEGNDQFYPEVNSLYSGDNNYAGYPGKPIQLLSIQAYNQDGTRLRAGVVVMYRVRVAGRWLPWVSNADAEWMQSVQKQYGLDGTLDIKSTYAGNKGQNIDGVEIRVFQGETDYQPVGPLPGAESSATLQYMTDSLSNWTSFTGTALYDHIDGIKIQTDPSKPYYLSYRSWNATKSNYYPYVDSRGTAYNDYAGYPGKPIQLLNIYAYANDGTKLKSGVVIMYRVHVDNRWLPWVSNANPEWMVSVQEKYDLGGTLDTKSTYAGNKGQNINGVEIHIFEENGTDGGTITPVGHYKIIPNVPFIYQRVKYPSGCESVSTVMALQYAGVNITVENFIDNYLDKGSNKSFDPNICFGGNPYSASGYGCYSPVIKKALDRILPNSLLYAKEEKGKSIEYLCSEYIDKNIPVIFWATQGMDTPRKSTIISYQGRYIQWISPMHCLLLVGYDDNHYIFNDPQEHALTYYSKESVQRAYDGLFQQAVVIKNYKRPDIPDVPNDAAQISDIITKIRQLEDEYQNYFRYIVVPSGSALFSPDKVLDGVLGYLRAPEYDDFEWSVTAGQKPDEAFINYVNNQPNSELNRYFEPYIRKGTRKLVTDGDRGLIDLAHMAATMSAYFGGVIPNFWASWGGDLATGMADTTARIAKRDNGENYLHMSNQEIADETIGGKSNCNYSDLCSDFDAYKLQIKAHDLLKQDSNFHPLSDAMNWYYSNGLHKKRFQWITEELACERTIKDLRIAIATKMKFSLLGQTVIDIKGNNPSEEVVQLCCNAFAKYIYTMIS
ncbi:MAG: C39 family peptidase [Candidatus Fimenecus sp.]